MTASSGTVTDLQLFKADFFKALAHPLRIRVLEALRAGEQSVQELQQALRVDQSTVSQQLGVLRRQRIVSARKEGTSVRYAVRDPRVGDLLDVARAIFDNQLVGTQSLLRELRREGPVPRTPSPRRRRPASGRRLTASRW